MIQNAQMHQVIMNNMTVSALKMFAHSGPVAGDEVGGRRCLGPLMRQT